MIIRLMEKGATLTWGPRISSDPGSGATTVVVIVAAAVAGAPGGDHLQTVVVATRPED
jgi:hypothetical protein